MPLDFSRHPLLFLSGSLARGSPSSDSARAQGSAPTAQPDGARPPSPGIILRGRQSKDQLLDLLYKAPEMLCSDVKVSSRPRALGSFCADLLSFVFLSLALHITSACSECG